jgi:hypothetical protein
MDRIQAEVQCVSEVKQALYSDLLVSNVTATTLYFSAVLRMVSVIISDSSDSYNWKSENFRKSLSNTFITPGNFWGRIATYIFVCL